MKRWWMRRLRTGSYRLKKLRDGGFAGEIDRATLQKVHIARRCSILDVDLSLFCHFVNLIIFSGWFSTISALGKIQISGVPCLL